MSKIKFLMIATTALVVIVVLSLSFKPQSQDSKNLILTIREVHPNDPPCLQMYFYIEKYADSFNIPKRYAYGMANVETGYKSPMQWRYNPNQISSTGAQGPMQILLSTARWLNKDNVSRDKLRTDIEYNIMTAMKYVRKLKDTYKTWDRTLGYYNTGYPVPNSYATNVMNFKIDWI